MTPAPLPPWPDIGPCREGWYSYPELPEQYRSSIHPYMVENRESGTWYHKDAYEAAMARLVVAVEALNAASKALDAVGAHVPAWAAKLAIGKIDLPPSSQERG
jgi:putative hemolysin